MTDANAILGIGDQGFGGIEICLGKAKVDTLCSGVNPNIISHVMLDVGTQNATLLAKPSYRGLKEDRARKDEYNLFIEAFIFSLKQVHPDILLHWEDFKS